MSNLQINSTMNGTPQFIEDSTTPTPIPSSLAISTDFVGIGTMVPCEKLEIVGNFVVKGDNLDTVDLSSTMPGSGRMLMGWNRSGGLGEADFITNRDGGSDGGFAFYDIDNAANENQLLRILGNGNCTIGPLLRCLGTAYQDGTAIYTTSDQPLSDAVVGGLFAFNDGTLRHIIDYTESYGGGSCLSVPQNESGSVSSQPYWIYQPGPVVQILNNVGIGTWAPNATLHVQSYFDSNPNGKMGPVCSELNYDYDNSPGDPYAVMGVGITSQINYGKNNTNAQGSALGVVVGLDIENVKSPESEFAGYFLALLAKKSSRVWGADFGIQGGDVDQQLDLLTGIVNCVNSYCSSRPTSGAQGMVVISKPQAGSGAGENEYYENMQTYPLDAGLAIVGYSGGPNVDNGSAFDKALQIGGTASGWMNRDGFSIFDTGIDITDYTINGIYIHDAHSGYAMVTTQNAGNVGIGTTTPDAKLEISGTSLFNGANANLGVADLTFLMNTGKMLIGWNRTNGEGEADFIASKDGGSIGGFAFYDINDSSGAVTQLMRIKGTGNVGIGTPSPNSTLQVNGSIAGKRSSVVNNANYSSNNETIIGVSTSTTAVQITLSVADTVAGRVLIIKDEGGYAQTRNITINRNGMRIDGAQSNKVINSQYGVIRLYSDGSNWFTF